MRTWTTRNNTISIMKRNGKNAFGMRRNASGKAIGSRGRCTPGGSSSWGRFVCARSRDLDPDEPAVVKSRDHRGHLPPSPCRLESPSPREAGWRRLLQTSTSRVTVVSCSGSANGGAPARRSTPPGPPPAPGRDASPTSGRQGSGAIPAAVIRGGEAGDRLRQQRVVRPPLLAGPLLQLGHLPQQCPRARHHARLRHPESKPFCPRVSAAERPRSRARRASEVLRPKADRLIGRLCASVTSTERRNSICATC
jgi:hypothetical protein